MELSKHGRQTLVNWFIHFMNIKDGLQISCTGEFKVVAITNNISLFFMSIFSVNLI